MAYAAVTSLIGTLHLHFLQSQPRLPLEDKQEMVSLHENLCFLQEILEKSYFASDNLLMKDLEAKIRNVSFKAEERIEMELSTIYLARGSTDCLLRLHEIFNEAVKVTDYLKKELIRITSEYHLAKSSSQNERITDISLLASTSSQPEQKCENVTVSEFSMKPSKFENRMLGCHEEFMTILDQLTRKSAKQRQVLAMVGMGGIGKTTLAQKIYEDPSITSHFDMRAWVTISQEYNVGQILQCLIDCVIAENDKRQSIDQLAESLYRRLKGQRYLVVIDDIWSTVAWDSLQRCFPDDNNGSRILLTSRLREVAEYASSGNSPLNMPFLDVDESWNLYCNVFGKTEFQFEFEKIGRDIVKKCKGLPLAIIVVARLLSKTEEEVEKWKSVAENVSRSVIGDSNEACSKILSLSYNQLPHHLKACFLYFGVFPEDYEIPVKKLVRLWVAEGFLGAVKHQNMEEVAMEYLQDLIDRSLVLVSKQSYNGKIKTIRMHDLLRDLCLREAQCENLLNVVTGKYYRGDIVGRLMLLKPCPWISISPRCFLIRIESYKFHSLHCFEFIDLSIEVLCRFKLLRVVDMNLGYWNFGGKVLNTENLVHLRYLALSLNGKVFHLKLQLFEHWNMQSLIIRGCGTFDSSQAYRIWKMPMLRNFYVEGIPFSLETSEVVHSHLETIYWLGPKCCTKNLFTMIPNLKELGILNGSFSSENSADCFYNFVQLGQLEKLSIKGWVFHVAASHGQLVFYQILRSSTCMGLVCRGVI